MAIAVSRTPIPNGGANDRAILNSFYEHGKPNGNIFYVNSNHDSKSDASGYGRSPDSPFATLDYAIGQCTANNDDVINVAAQHAETIIAADGVNADVAGITIIGHGKGDKRPTFTMGTATTATFGINADNVTIKNLRFVGNIDSLATFLDVDNAYFVCEDCDFFTSSTKEALAFVDLATTVDNFWFKRCNFYQPTDPAGTDGGAGTGCFYIVDSENIFIEDCHFYGNFETAIFHNRTTACKNLWVKNCTGIQALSGAEPFQLVAAASGASVGGAFLTPAETAAVEATLVGTLGDAFFVCGTYFGNDGLAGGQGGILATAAS